MGFSRISFHSFRNLKDAEVGVGADKVFLIGENGQGKTNFLEAIYLLCYGSSFRGAFDSEIARSGSEGLYALYGSGSDAFSDVTLRFDVGKKNISLGGKTVVDRKELVSVRPCIAFSHEDMKFVSGSPERRRWFLDQTLALLDPQTLDGIRDFKKILLTRNALLREGKESLLDLVDEQFVESGLRLIAARAALVKAFDEFFRPLYSEISGFPEGVSIVYKPSWRELGRETILGVLREKRGMELQRGASCSGPHRDRIEYSRGGQPFEATASTGQLRLLALSLRVAQAEHFHSTTGRKAVLLLDDVLLELDPEKRRRFVAKLPESDQSFFTFLPGEPFSAYADSSTLVYWVKDGRFGDKESF